MQRAIVIPAGSQHERLAVPIRKQRHTCMSTSATGQSAGHAACCLLPATIAHTRRRLHRPSYHCHTVAQFHLETEHSSKPSRPRVCASLVANTLLEPPPLEIITTYAISNTNTLLLRSRRRSRFQSASPPHAVSLSIEQNDVHRAKDARTGCLDTFR
jgi:hypothetical protein